MTNREDKRMEEERLLKEAGGYAFPRAGTPSAINSRAENGMTLRDWFAGQALAGGIADGLGYKRGPEAAYAFADAMLTVRARRKTPSDYPHTFPDGTVDRCTTCTHSYPKEDMTYDKGYPICKEVCMSRLGIIPPNTTSQ